MLVDDAPEFGQLMRFHPVIIREINGLQPEDATGPVAHAPGSD